MDMDFQQTTTAVAFLFVGDRARALAFYRDTLGATVRSEDQYGDFLEIGGALLRMTVMSDYQARPDPALGWAVDDVSAAVRLLRARGVAFTVYEGMGQDDLGVWTSPDGASKLAWFPDPDGNVLMLSQTAT